MTEFRRNELVNFIQNGAKSPPPVFVGRQDIIEDILDKSRHAFKRGGAAPGNTIIIQGAPGAGKTSILTEVSQRETQEENAPRIVVVTNDEIMNRRPEVMTAIAVAASKPKNEWFTALKTKGTDLGQRIGNVSFLSFSADFAQITQQRDPVDLYTLARMIPSDKWVHPVILAIDEAQRFEETRNSPPARFLQSIHDANQVSLPLTLLFAGLSDTQYRVNEMGITNGIAALTVDVLNGQEQTQVIDGFCTYFGVDVGSQRKTLHTFFESTDGWPRHIFWAQQALAEILFQPEVNGNLDRITDWAIAEQRRDQFRIGYYEDRRSLALKRSKKLVGAVMKTVDLYNNRGTKIDFPDIGDKIEYFTKQFKSCGRGWRVPESFGSGESGIDRYIEHLIHQGALVEDVWSDTYRCPIPSFQSHLIERAGFTPVETAELEQKLAADLPDNNDGYEP